MHRAAMSAGVLAAAMTCAASAQLVVGNDQSAATNQMYYIDLTSGTATSILSGSSAIAWGMAYAPGSNTLYWNNGVTLRESTFSQSGLTPSAGVAMTFNGANISLTGLAWWNNRLVGYRSVTLPGIYQIDPITGVTTLLAATPASTDFGGLDADNGRLFGLNDGTGLQGRGLYSIDVDTNSYSLIAPYPAGDTDIDGLAVGGGRAYWVNDVGSQSILVYNLTTNMFEASISSPFGTGGIFAAGAFIPAPGAAAVLGLSGAALIRRRR